MCLKSYISILLTIGLVNNFQGFTDACIAQGLEPLPRNKFMDLEFDLTVAMRDYPSICPYLSYVAKKGISKGLGDTVAKIAHAIGIDKFAEVYTQVTGNDCGCKGRQDALNKLVPYES